MQSSSSSSSGFEAWYDVLANRVLKTGPMQKNIKVLMIPISILLGLVFFTGTAHAYSTIQENQDTGNAQLDFEFCDRTAVGFTASTSSPFTAFNLRVQNNTTTPWLVRYYLHEADSQYKPIGNPLAFGSYDASLLPTTNDPSPVTTAFPWGESFAISQGHKYSIVITSSKYPTLCTGGLVVSYLGTQPTNGSYPTYIEDDDNLPAGWQAFGYSPKIALLTGSATTHTLTIEQPRNGSTQIATPINIEGFCPNEDVNFKMCSETVGGTEISCAWGSTVCYNDEWISSGFDVGTTTTSWYRITATTTNATTTSFFLFRFGGSIGENANSTSTPEIFLPDFQPTINLFGSCPIPFLGWDPCYEINKVTVFLIQAFVGTVKRITDASINAKPYSYVLDVKQAFDTANQTHTSTITGVHFTSATSSINVDMYLFTATSTTLILSQQDWNNLRPGMNLLLYLIFALWIYTRFIKSV